MAAKAPTSPRQKAVNFLLGPVGLTLLLGALVVAVAFIVNRFDNQFIAAAIEWFRGTSPGSDSSTVLIAVGSISVVVWTGALIAFQLKGTSVQLSGALSLLEYAFIAPLAALLFQGGALRVIAALATLAFVALILRQALLYFIIKWLINKTAAGDPDREFLATAFGRRIFKAVAGTTIFPIGYASACAVASLIIIATATEYVVAVTSVGTLCFGLYYVLAALKDNKIPPTPEQRATANKALSSMVAIFQRRADELTNSARTSGKAASESEAPATPSGSEDSDSDTETEESRAKQKAERLTRIAEFKEVAAFLEPLIYKEIRPGLLTKEQVEKARRVLSYAMTKALNDEEGFNASIGLALLLAAVAPEGSENAS